MVLFSRATPIADGGCRRRVREDIMTDKSKRRARELARRRGTSHQGAVNHQRRPLQAVLNASERDVKLKLEGAAVLNGARVLPKVRLADLVKIEHSGISNTAYRYALQCHLDFVVVDAETRPLFAVEFDGRGHNSCNDPLKEDLCERFGMPLARADHRHADASARGLDAIEWLAEVYFAHRGAADAQEAGIIPDDEPLDPLMMAGWLRSSEPFPLCLAAEVAVRAERLFKAGQIASPYLFHVAFGDGRGRATAMTTLRVARDRFLAVRETIYLRGFGIGAGGAAAELAMAQVGPLLSAHLDGQDVAVGGASAYENLLAVAKMGQFEGGGGFTSDPEDFTFDLLGPGGDRIARIVPPETLVH